MRFDGNDDRLEVGHMLGLRWFTLQADEHRITREHPQPVEITSFGDPGRVYLDTPSQYSCTCGYRSVVPPFPPDHPEGGAVLPALKGARGLWHPGENEAICLSHGGGSYAAGGAGQGTVVYSPGTGYAVSGGGTGYSAGNITFTSGGGGGGAGGTVWAGGGSVTYAPHLVPARNCGCGFWAYWSLGSVQVSHPAVVGIIKGYGRYEWGELGFRCSHAKIEAIHLPTWDTAAALAIEDRYGVDVYSNFLAMLEMFRDRTPQGQPPLTDSFFVKGLFKTGTQTPLLPKLRHSGDATAAALRAGRCATCGGPSSGGRYCATCGLAPATPATLTGPEALRRAHAIREKWAAETGKSVKAMSEAIAAASATTRDVTAQMQSLAKVMNYIAEKYGKPQDGRKY